MTKVYTSTARIITSSGIAHMHVGPDVAFTKNGKLTTAKRALEEAHDVDLQNWSYRLDGDVPADGEKVYTIQQRVIIGGTPSYIQVGPDVAYVSKKKASKAVRALRQSTEGDLVLFSFTINTPREVGPVAPAYQEYTVTVMATSQEEADELAQGINARLGMAA